MKRYTERKVRGEISMSSGFDVLIDSDIFVALFMPEDLLAEEAQRLYQQLKAGIPTKFVTTNMVVAETATVLSNRAGHQVAKQFLDRVAEMDVWFINEDLERETHQLFRQQTKSRGISMVDCANVVVMRRLHIGKIFSFDKFYKDNAIPRVG